MNKKIFLVLLLLITCLIPEIAGATEYRLPDFLNISSPSNPTGDPNIVVGRVIRLIIGLSGSIALIFFIYGGFLWLTSAGNPNNIDKGRNAMLWSAIGIIVVLTSYILVRFVFSLIGA